MCCAFAFQPHVNKKKIHALVTYELGITSKMGIESGWHHCVSSENKQEKKSFLLCVVHVLSNLDFKIRLKM